MARYRPSLRLWRGPSAAGPTIVSAALQRRVCAANSLSACSSARCGAPASDPRSGRPPCSPLAVRTWAISLVMTAFGIGAALPLLVLGLLSREAMVAWRGRLLNAGKAGKMALGGLLLALGLMIASGLDKRIERPRRPLAGMADGAHHAVLMGPGKAYTRDAFLERARYQMTFSSPTASIVRATFTGSAGVDLSARLDHPAGAVRAFALFAHC